VGDLSFVLKCHRKIVEFREKGGSIILVSHGMQLVRNTCNHVVWMDKGKIMESGKTAQVCDHYESYMYNKGSIDPEDIGSVVNTDNLVHIENVEFLNGQNEKIESIKTGDYLRMRIYYNCKREVKNPIFGIGISNVEGINVINNFSKFDPSKNIRNLNGGGFVDVIMEGVDIALGNYYCTVVFAENDLINTLDWHEKKYLLKIESSETGAQGLFHPKISWEFQ
jgi:hypothetical protein